MTVETPFSKSLDALSGFKAEGRQVFGMARTPNGWKLDVQEPKTPPAALQARETTLSQPHSSGTSQSRPYPARPAKIMESAGQSCEGTGAVGVGGTAEKQNVSAGNGSGQTNLATDHVLPSPEPPTSPLREGRERPEGVSAPVMVKCFDCGVEHPADQECKICAPLARAMIAARERRKKYHDYKHGLASRPI